MAKWLKNTSCPNCGSKDNLGVYEDGSTWCWGCHTYTKGRPMLLKKLVEPLYTNVKLPDDTSGYIPQQALDWLSKYSLTLWDFNIPPIYSNSRELFIFPFYDAEFNLKFWQGRLS